MHRSGDTDQKEPPDQLSYPSPTTSSSSKRYSQTPHPSISNIPEDNAIDPTLFSPSTAEGFQYPRPPLPHHASSGSGSSRSLGMSPVNSGSRGIREGHMMVEGWGTSPSHGRGGDEILPPPFAYPSQPFSFRPPSPSRSHPAPSAHYSNSPPHNLRQTQSIQTTLPPLAHRSNTSSSLTGWSSSSGSNLSPISPLTSQLPQLPPISSYETHPGYPSHATHPSHGRYEPPDLPMPANPALRAGPSGLGIGVLPDYRSSAGYESRFVSGPLAGPSEMRPEGPDVQSVYPMGRDAGFMIINTEAGPSKRRMSGKNNTPAACAACKRAHLACDREFISSALESCCA